jgi:pimeloyl-ACP methyl ester carboxylesterase
MSRHSRAIAAITLLLWASPAMAAELPVLFIHGFCSNADTWNDTLPQLSTRRYGDDAPKVYESASGKAAARTTVSTASKTFRIDFSDLKNGFDLLAVANVPTDRKAGELKVVIDAIKKFTGAPAVILVGHSLGGLAARSYIQGTGLNRNGATIPYGRDVAALIMIDTPNQGSGLAVASGAPRSQECILADTANLRDLEPASPFLRDVNAKQWASGTEVHSIVSSNTDSNSDDVVTTTSQDLQALPQYAAVPDARRWVQTFPRNGILHIRVQSEPATVSLFTGIISDLDKK